MKVLNLYSGIGGNRKLWQDVEVTAVENNESIAKVYQDYFPEDKMIIGDAHQYLLDHFKEFNFIWSSPPCPTHSRIRINFQDAKGGNKRAPVYPNMSLYQEIIFLGGFFKGQYCVENVKPYYTPLIPAVEIERHLFWSNFKLNPQKQKTSDKILRGSIEERYKIKGFDVSDKKGINKERVINNCVRPETGLYILNCARNIITKSTHQTALEL